ncbi:MAG: hypothetical protein IJY94_04985 [Clostridia bacterium]|nr:hypothetical protein [Clostridia bacterium]
MKNLNIEAPRIPLCINGKEFSFIPDSEFASRLSLLADEAGKRAEMCKETGEDACEASAFLSYAVDTLIGDGAVEKIFGDVLPDPVDLCDILGYVADAFHSYRRRRLKRLKEGS